MRRLCSTFLFGLLVAALPMASGAQVASAAPDPAQELERLNRQLGEDQAKLNELNDRVEKAEAEVDRLNRTLAADQKRESQLVLQTSALARVEYQRPALTLSTILEARGLDQLLSNLAQAQLVARKQHNLATQARQLRREDELARDQQAAKMSEVQASRDEAAQVAARTLKLRDAANDEVLRARAAAVAEQARATTQVATRSSVSIPPPSGVISQATGPNRFAYGYCTWYVANRRYIPWLGNAIEWWGNASAAGYAEGQTPMVGAVMVTRESGYGHVAYVESVNGDGSWTVSEMNYAGWNVISSRTLRPGQAPVVGFIYGKA